MPELTVSVSELNEYVRDRLHGDPFLKHITVRGEISDYRQQMGSGHAYFTIKDEKAVLSCTMWRSNVSLLRFVPRVGKKVTVHGQVTLYVPAGKYQLIADSMTEEGQGDLFRRFEELKNRLMAEGLFDAALKKPLPLKVKTIGVATSLSGAAIRDIIKVARARNPRIDIIVAPCAVQGKGAEFEIASAVDALDKDGRAEVILVGRGGGSMEDLWAFNEEPVARAVYRCKTPVISCVGHETDYSICDFAADVRASTPSNAAELAVADVRELTNALENLNRRLGFSMTSGQKHRRQRLGALLRSRAFTKPRETLIGDRLMRLEALKEKLVSAQNAKMNFCAQKTEALRRLLDTLNPSNIKKRGYAVVRGPGGVIGTIDAINAGDTLNVELMDGEFTAAVGKIGRYAHGEEAHI